MDKVNFRSRVRGVAATVLTLVTTAAGYVACGDGSTQSSAPDSGSETTGGDASNGSDGSVSGSDAQGSSDAGGTSKDAAFDADAAPVAVSDCSAPVRVDTLGGVLGGQSPNFLAESFGDEFVVMWHENAAVAADAKNHVKARAFDGSMFGTEIDLAQFVFFQSRMGGDGSGHAFAEWSSSSGGSVRAVFDFGTLSFGAPTAFSFAGGSAADMTGAGAGVGISLYENAGSLNADKWQTATGWATTSLSAVASAASPRISGTKMGRAVAAWDAVDTFVAAYDGGAWGATTTETVDAGGGVGSAYSQLATLANGDAIFMFEAPGSIQAARYRASTNTFDAPVYIEVQPNVVQESSGGHFVVVDSQDRITVAWERYVGALIHTWASRSFDQGVTWSTPTDFGPSNTVMLGVAPNDIVVAATYGNGQNAGSGVGNEGVYLRASGATDTSWSPPVETSVQTDQGGNYGSLSGSARLLFNTKFQVILLANQIPEAGPNYTIQAVTCSL